MPSIRQASAAQSTVSCATTVATNTPNDITIVIVDANGDGIEGIPASQIVLAVSSTNNTVTQPTGSTNASGEIFGATFQSSTTGERTVTVTVSGLAMSDSPVVNVGGASSVLFESTWETATGAAYSTALTDGGIWNQTYPCSEDPSTTLSIVADGGSDPGTGNTFRVGWSGVESACGAVEARNYWTAGQSHYGRIWFRRIDDQFAGSFHNFSYNFVGDIQHVFFNPLGRGSNLWSWGIGAGRSTAYPFRYWRSQTAATNPPPYLTFDCNVWYRFEWHLEFLEGGTRFRNWPRLYAENGTTILADANDLYGEDTPFATTLTLADWYALGNTFDVENATEFRYLGIGNEGQTGHPLNATMHEVRHLRISSTGWVGTAV